MPGLQAGRGPLEEIEDVLLRQLEQGAAPFVVKAGFALAFLARHGAPQVVVGPLRLEQALALAPLLRGEIRNLLARVAVHAVAAQGMRRVEHALDGGLAVALLASGDVVLGEFEIGEDAFGVRPDAEQVVVLEEVVVAEGGMGDDERLHRRRVLLHDVADAGIGVDDDLVGEGAQPLAVADLVLGEMLAERPMLVEQRHADRRIGVEHLLGRDDLDLVRIDVEAELVDGDTLDGVVDPSDRVEIPIGPLVEQGRRVRRERHRASPSAPLWRANSSRKTG